MTKHFWLMMGAVACVSLGQAPPVSAANHALLVAVSDYNPKIIRPLKGPGNDVRIVWDLLRERKFDAARITVLADRMAPGKTSPRARIAPTRSNILAAFDRLEKTIAAAKNERHFVFVYFSGHGSRQPQFEATDDVEPDGFDEVFLPLDTGRIDPFSRKIRNGLADDEIRKRLSALRAAGNVFVWVVLDACHSGDMLRGVNKQVQAKYVPADSLVPEKDRDLWKKQVEAMQAKRRTRGGVRPYVGGGLMDGAKKTAGMVAFSAVHEDKLALELPVREAQNTIYSVFTYHLVKAVRQSPQLSFRGLADSISRLHSGFGAALPGPVFEGDLDRAFAMSAKAAQLRWPARIGADRETIEVAAGSLSGLIKGTILQLHGAGKTRFAGYLRVTSSTIAGAVATPAPFRGKPAPVLGGASSALTVSLAAQKIDTGLRVHVDGADAKVQAVLAAYRKQNGSTGASKLPVAWVRDGDDADVYLIPANNNLYLARRSSAAEKIAESGHFAVPLTGSAETAAKLLRENFWKLLRQRNLLRIAAANRDGNVLKDVSVRMFRIAIGRAGSASGDRFKCPVPDLDAVASGGERLSLINPAQLHNCDVLRLELENNSKKPVQAAALLMGPDASVKYFNLGNRPVVSPGQILPATSFIQINTRCAPADCRAMGLASGKQILGRERLMLVLFELGDGASPTSLAYLAQSSLSRAQKQMKVVLRRAISPMEAMLRNAALVSPLRSMTAVSGTRATIRLLQWDLVR